MSKEKIKVYLYTRVSTAMQIDGYSLEAQKTKMKAFCDYNEYEIVGKYEDAVSYVLVFKLSGFGRNAADVLATLQVMQDFGVNLICVEDGIDSSKDAGKLMMLDTAVAEVISKLVSNPKFSNLIRSKINMEVDTGTLDQEIANYEKKLRQLYHNKDSILPDIDSLDYKDKHYQRRKTDLENRLYKNL